MDNKLFFLTFLGGIGCGFAAGITALNSEYEKKLDEQVSKIKHNLETYNDIQLKIENKKEEYRHTGEETNTGREQGLLTNEERVQIKEDWSIDNSEIFDYTKFYTQKQPDAMIIKEPEKAIDTVSDESQEEISEYSKEIRRSSMPPRILSDKEVKMIPEDEYTFVKLYYYMYDDTIVRDSDDPDSPWRAVTNYEDLIGDCLTKNGFDSNSEEVLYIINNQLKEVYSVKKKWASFTT